jgi:hypothetical protein
MHNTKGGDVLEQMEEEKTSEAWMQNRYGKTHLRGGEHA